MVKDWPAVMWIFARSQRIPSWSSIVLEGHVVSHDVADLKPGADLEVYMKAREDLLVGLL